MEGPCATPSSTTPFLEHTGHPTLPDALPGASMGPVIPCILQCPSWVIHGHCATPSSVTPLPEHPRTLQCPVPCDTLLGACMATVMVDDLLQSPSWGTPGPHDTLPRVSMDSMTHYILQCPSWDIHGPRDPLSLATPFLGPHHTPPPTTPFLGHTWTP